MLALGHTFIPDSINNGPNGVPGLSGTDCLNSNTGTGNTCADGSPKFRTAWPVNLGTISTSFTQINLGGTMRF
jgi:hypothetical protein